MFLKISQNSLGYTCASCWAWPATFWKGNSSTGVFQWILQNFKEHLHFRTSANGCIWVFYHRVKIKSFDCFCFFFKWVCCSLPFQHFFDVVVKVDKSVFSSFFSYFTSSLLLSFAISLSDMISCKSFILSKISCFVFYFLMLDVILSCYKEWILYFCSILTRCYQLQFAIFIIFFSNIFNIALGQFQHHQVR